ncbi:Pentatricopeptide repeat [Dillenia turbinata]|uniref:Pentatricopeptide repeat n=1 Tax=Dillenia turbinata TaxID=194707 RepID=A0AAN8VYC8_9MAGN
MRKRIHAIISSNHLKSLSVLYSTSVYTQTITLPRQPINPSKTLNKNISKISLQAHYIKNFSSLYDDLSKNTKNFAALKTLDELLGKIHLYDSSTSLFIIEGLCRLKKLNRAKSVLLSLKDKGGISQFFFYSVLFDCLVKEGSINDVETAFYELFGSKYHMGISEFIIHLCKFGDFAEIKPVTERILMVDSCRLKWQSYIALIGVLCRNNEGLLAKEVLRDMNDKGLKADNFTYYAMYECFCRNGELDQADLILRKLAKRKYAMDISIFGNFIYALCKAGKFREANKLFRKLIKGDRFRNFKVESLKEGQRAIFQLNCRGVVPEFMAYETYFRSLCSTGRIDDAEVLLKRMMKSRTVPEICIYGSFVKALFRASREEDALKFYNVERKKGLFPANEIAGYVIMELCRKGKVDDAVAILNEVFMGGKVLGHADVCNCILRSYWKLGRVSEAERFYGKMKDGSFGEVLTVLSNVIMLNGHCNQGDASKGHLELVPAMNFCSEDGWISKQHWHMNLILVEIKYEKVKLAVLQLYKVNDSGKVQRLWNVPLLANHSARNQSGNCGLPSLYVGLW